MVDEVVLVRTAIVPDAGSTADSFEIFTHGNFAENCGCGCGSKAGDLAHFGAARNRSFEIAKGDWLTWIDSDDVVDGDANALRDLVANGAVRAHCLYAYSSEQSYYLPRLVPRAERWSYPIHEYLPGTSGARSSKLVWRHERTSGGNRESIARNWRLMTHHMTVDAGVYGHDARMWYFWGRALVDVGKPIPALPRLEKAYAMEVWNEQRSVIAMLLARSLPLHLVDMRRAWGWKAVQDTPRWPSAWRTLADTYEGQVRADFVRHASSLPLEDSFLVANGSR
jgi:hypothetical protein